MHIVLAIAAAAALGGCATIGYLTTEYGGGRHRDGEVQTASGTTFWVWDHQSKPRFMVTADAAQSAVHGASFGAAKPDNALFKEAGDLWIAKRHPGCRAASAERMIDLYYEVTYVCEPPLQAQAR